MCTYLSIWMILLEVHLVLLSFVIPIHPQGSSEEAWLFFWKTQVDKACWRMETSRDERDEKGNSNGTTVDGRNPAPPGMYV